MRIKKSEWDEPAVVTVEFAVAAERSADAASVAAAEFRFAAVARSAALLVGIVTAVVVVVAAPAARNALAVVALEVGRFAGMDVRIGARIRFVLAGRTVAVAVAFPRQRDAATRTAPEVVVRARTLGARHRFIRSIIHPSINQYSISHQNASMTINLK